MQLPKAKPLDYLLIHTVAGVYCKIISKPMRPETEELADDIIEFVAGFVHNVDYDPEKLSDESSAVIQSVMQNSEVVTLH